MLDLDGKDSIDTFLERGWILKGFGIRVMQVLCYDTTNGYHLFLNCDNELTDYEIVFIQLLLGSDWRKEAFSLLRIKQGCKDWNVLFTKKIQINKLQQETIKSQEKYNPKLSKTLMRILEGGFE